MLLARSPGRRKTRFHFFFPANLLKSLKTAKKKFGKIWKSLAARIAASLMRKGFFEPRNFAKRAFSRAPKVFQICGRHLRRRRILGGAGDGAVTDRKTQQDGREHPHAPGAIVSTTPLDPNSRKLHGAHRFHQPTPLPRRGLGRRRTPAAPPRARELSSQRAAPRRRRPRPRLQRPRRRIRRVPRIRLAEERGARRRRADQAARERPRPRLSVRAAEARPARLHGAEGGGDG